MSLNLGTINQSVTTEETLPQDILSMYDAYVDLKESLMAVQNSHEILAVASRYKSSTEGISAIEELAGTSVDTLDEVSTEAIKYGVAHLITFLERINRALNGLKAKANRLKNRDFSKLDPKLLQNKNELVSSKNLEKIKSYIEVGGRYAGVSGELMDAYKDLTSAVTRLLNTKTFISDPKATMNAIAEGVSKVVGDFPRIIEQVKKHSDKISGAVAITNAATTEIGQAMINAGLDKVCKGIVRVIGELHRGLNVIDRAIKG